MSMQDLLLPDWTVPQIKTETHIRKYSTTGDILSFKRCPRQYGFFGVRGFVSATNTQRYFGNLVHDVLDRINRTYQTSRIIPDHDTITQLVDEAHERLFRSGVRPYKAGVQREYATKLIERFVTMIGPRFFPYVKETEYRLERALKTETSRDYILTGVVDVLSGAVSHALELPYSTMAEDVEIWDYKSNVMPEKDSRELRDYEYQMRVYAELYRQQAGEYPARSVLVFVGEAGLVITRIRYNSPLDITFSSPNFDPKNIADALVTTIDGITQRKAKLEQAELENQAQAQAIKLAERQAEQEQQMAALEREKQALEIERERLALVQQQLDLQKQGIEYALEIAKKTVDLLQPNADDATKGMIMQELLPNILQLQNGKGLVLALPEPKNDG